MKRKNLGITEIFLPAITLDYEFGTNQTTDITSFLSDEQKQSIKNALCGSKIVLLTSADITDGGGSIGRLSAIVYPHKANDTSNYHYVDCLVHNNENDALVGLSLSYNEEEDFFEIYC